MASVAQLYVYPVKGLSPQRLTSVDLEAGRGFPFDREYALARRDGDYRDDAGTALPKKHYLMLMRDERLAEAHTALDPATGMLTASHPSGTLEADLATEEGRDRAARYFADLLGLPDELRPVIAHQPGRRYTDVATRGDEPMHWLSLINLASVRDLEQHTGKSIDPLRFRANIYLEAGEAFVESEWVGREFSLGDVRLRGVRVTRRCPATEVDPWTGARDLPVVDLLSEEYGDDVMGIYAEVLSGGTLTVGSPLVLD